jgi:hypothetical protein
MHYFTMLRFKNNAGAVIFLFGSPAMKAAKMCTLALP